MAKLMKNKVGCQEQNSCAESCDNEERIITKSYGSCVPSTELELESNVLIEEEQTDQSSSTIEIQESNLENTSIESSNCYLGCPLIRIKDPDVSHGSKLVECYNWEKLIFHFAIIGILFVGLTLVMVYGPRLFRSDKYRLKFVGVTICTMLVILTYIYFPLKNRIPRLFFGKRKFTLAHNYSLSVILSRLYALIPNEECLKRIDTKACEKVALVQQHVERDFRCPMEVFMTGSTAERMSLPVLPCWIHTEGLSETSHAIISDFDYMISPQQETACLAGASNENEKYSVITNHPYLQKGFALLFNQSGDIVDARTFRNNMFNLVKSMKVKDFFGHDIVNRQCCFYCASKRATLYYAHVKLKGPATALSLGTSVLLANRFYSDLIFAIKCSQWPDVVSDWMRRLNKKWPKHSDCVRISSYGCHLIPKSQPGDLQGLSWRISFSRAEVELSKLIPPTARMCMIGLKIIAKDYLSVACRRISSYQLKCILFFTLENTDPEFWLQTENLEQCFALLLKNLSDAVANKNCPHFWIPQINLFTDFKRNDLKRLTKVLRKISKSPASFIEDFQRLPTTSTSRNAITPLVNLSRLRNTDKLEETDCDIFEIR